jgi:TonB family protein
VVAAAGAIGFESGVASSSSLAHSLTIAGSIALHVSVLWHYAGTPRHARQLRSELHASEIEVNIHDDVQVPVTTRMTEPAAPAGAVAWHGVRARAAAARDPVHAVASQARSSLVPPAPLAPDPTALPAVGATVPPRFTLLGAPAALPTAAQPSSERTGIAAAPTVVWNARDVTEPARLLTTSRAIYPEAATAAGIETDVVLELVLDESGHVQSARPRSHLGYGLEQAALDAIRAYRFSPARRAGRPVRVRLCWTVSFRLR